MESGDVFLKTDVDQFLELIRKNKRISLSEASKALNIPFATVQAWTDFLVEEKIIGIEYKFTTPYVFLNTEAAEKLDMPHLGFETKDEFYKKARKKGMSENQIKLLWLKYVNMNKNTIKQVFFERARERGLTNTEKIEEFWQKYLKYLETDEK
ncbi:MAG: hypothetical protein QXK37_00960 [Candidatus Woesearchaeota archaeon]